MKNIPRLALLCSTVLVALGLLGCRSSKPLPPKYLPPDKQLGLLESLDPRFEKLIHPDAPIEILATGFGWAEGPVWIENKDLLLFTDIPANKIMQWHEADGLSTYMENAGYNAPEPRRGSKGANGLTVDSDGRLHICQHGHRRVIRQHVKENKRDKSKPPETYQAVVADRFQGRRFNSPNDLVFHSNGHLYFTDPPYGLPEGVTDPTKEIPFQGVYRLNKKGKVRLLTSELSRPNGIAFSPDESILYVANSDRERAIWMAYDVQSDGSLDNGRVFFDATSMVGKRKGLPDGLKVDRDGNVFATGPGGVLVFAPDGTHLGTIRTGVATANCAWGDDGSVLYITADSYLCRIQTNTRGDIP